MENVDEAVRAVLADTPPMTEESFAAGRARVLAGRPARRGPGRWLALAAGVAVLAAGGVVAVLSTPSAAAEALTKAASVVTSDPEVRPGQYLYTSTRDWAMAVDHGGGGKFSYLYEGVSEVWRPQDWRGEWFSRYTVTGKRQWVEGTEADARAAGVVIEEPRVTERAAPCGEFVPEFGATTPCAPGTWLNPKPDFIAGLPRDPDELRRQLLAHPSLGPVESAADVLSTGWVPHDLRAALYQALAGVPGIRITDRAVNLDGRVGVAFSAGDGRTGQEIVIDPGTGQFIGSRLVSTAEWEGLPAGTVWSFTSVITAVADTRP